MRNMTTMYWVLPLVLLLSACATGQDTGGDEVDSESELELEFELVPEEPQKLAVEFVTEPPGGQIRLPKLNREVVSGETLELEPGEYEVRATRDGYRPVESRVGIEQGQDTPVAIEFDKGFGTLFLERTTPNAKVTLVAPDGRRDITFDQGATRKLTLDAGEYTLVARRAGYHPLRESIPIEPGTEIEREIALREKPRTTPVTVATDPTAAEVQLNGEAKGQGEVDLGRLPFGEYELRAVHSIDERNRLITRQSIELSQRDRRQITLELDREERLFDGEWFPVAEARQKEETRYRDERVDNPGLVELELDQSAHETLVTTSQLPEKFHSWLRVGDRIKLRHANGAVVFWKRHRELTANLSRAMEALKQEESYIPDFQADPPAFERRIEAGEAPLWQVIHRLHRSRAEHALLDLRAAQLSGDAAQVPRTRADGALTVFARSEQAIRVNDTQVQPTSGIAVARIDPGDEAINLSWQDRPDHLLLVGDRSPEAVKQPKGGFLKLGEKKLVRLTDGRRVQRLDRLTAGPGYAEWQHESLDRSGPMGDEIDLSRDEIGPHQEPGDYRRVWLVQVVDDGGVTQRQIEVGYTARRQDAKFTTDTFLRHGQDATERE